MVKTPQDWMRQAIEMAVQNVRFQHGGPFGALVVRDGEVVGSGVNSVIAMNDPTAHAEIVAIRAACHNLDSFQLTGCELYSSCEPCPMCMGAIYWARPERVYFGCSRSDAGEAGFDDALIYRELGLAPGARAIAAIPLLRDEALAAFTEWAVSPVKMRY
ncbi:MAG: nucleoside deaminase [Acidobacteriaceae bacterium]|nr:nucleoside deaminase [Acidobacteriaceae bacterium]